MSTSKFRHVKQALERRASRLFHQDNITPDLPRGVISFTFDDCPKSVVTNALPLLEDKGWLGTIYLSGGRCGMTNHLGLHMSEADAQAVYASGHEIGDHTFSHLDGQAVTIDQTRADIAENRAMFDRLGLPHATSFAYPFGAVSPKLKQALSGEFESLRGITKATSSVMDMNLLPSTRLYCPQTIEAGMAHIKWAAETRQWLTLFTHDVREQPSQFGCTPQDFAKVVDLVASLNLDVHPVGDMAKAIRS